MMSRALALTVILLMAPALGAQTVYRCTTPEGGTAFSDAPCAEEGEAVEIDSPLIGGQFSSERPDPDGAEAEEATEPREEQVEDRSSDPCRTYTSTEIRRLEINGEVEAGMNREQVEAAWGRPTERYEAPIERWIYDNRYYGRTYSVRNVYFESGCVTEVTVTKP